MGRSELVLHVQPLEGLMRRLDGTVEKRFAKKEMLYPLQVYPAHYIHPFKSRCFSQSVPSQSTPFTYVYGSSPLPCVLQTGVTD